MASDRLFGWSILVIALAYIASATQIQAGFFSDPVGSRIFPYLVGGVAIVCALGIILRPDEDPTWPPMSTTGRILIAIIVMFGFAVSLKPLGFLIPAAVASALLSFLIRPDPIRAIAAGIGLSIGLFLIFRFAFGLGLAPFGRDLLSLMG